MAEGKITITLSERERDLMLAALRFWQDDKSKALLNPVIAEIATNAGTHDPLTENEIDGLAGRINDLDG